jgi:hypothetical protein
LGIEFGPINAHETREVIELLDDYNEDILNDFIQDDVAIKIERGYGAPVGGSKTS